MNRQSRSNNFTAIALISSHSKAGNVFKVILETMEYSDNAYSALEKANYIILF